MNPTPPATVATPMTVLTIFIRTTGRLVEAGRELLAGPLGELKSAVAPAAEAEGAGRAEGTGEAKFVIPSCPGAEL